MPLSIDDVRRFNDDWVNRLSQVDTFPGWLGAILDSNSFRRRFLVEPPNDPRERAYSIAELFSHRDSLDDALRAIALAPGRLDREVGVPSTRAEELEKALGTPIARLRCLLQLSVVSDFSFAYLLLKEHDTTTPLVPFLAAIEHMPELALMAAGLTIDLDGFEKRLSEAATRWQEGARANGFVPVDLLGALTVLDARMKASLLRVTTRPRPDLLAVDAAKNITKTMRDFLQSSRDEVWQVHEYVAIHDGDSLPQILIGLGTHTKRMQLASDQLVRRLSAMESLTTPPAPKPFVLTFGPDYLVRLPMFDALLTVSRDGPELFAENTHSAFLTAAREAPRSPIAAHYGDLFLRLDRLHTDAVAGQLLEATGRGLAHAGTRVARGAACKVVSKVIVEVGGLPPESELLIESILEALFEEHVKRLPTEDS